MINKERVTLFCTGFGLNGYELAQEQYKAGNLTDGEFMAVELFWALFGYDVHYSTINKKWSEENCETRKSACIE